MALRPHEPVVGAGALPAPLCVKSGGARWTAPPQATPPSLNLQVAPASEEKSSTAGSVFGDYALSSAGAALAAALAAGVVRRSRPRRRPCIVGSVIAMCAARGGDSMASLWGDFAEDGEENKPARASASRRKQKGGKKRNKQEDASDEAGEFFDAEEADRREAWSDEVTQAFWNEQDQPTPGKGGKPRDTVVEKMPDPLPSLAPGEVGAEESQDFDKAYGGFATTIMDVDGLKLDVPEFKTFEEAADELQFPDFLRAGLALREYSMLTPVQRATLPLLVGKRDLLASAVTGSGKTAAFMLPILMSLHQITRLVPGSLVAAYFKKGSGARSPKPMLGRVRGIHLGFAGIEFQSSSGRTHRQLVPPEWVVGIPEPAPKGPYKGPARPLAIVLEPTRELVEQVHNEAVKFTPFSPLRSVALSGDSSVKSQLRDLAHGVDILVSTPGRLVDALHRGVVKLSNVRHLVLDEVDQMMELGFDSQLKEIVEAGGMPSTLSGQRHTSFWSATMPNSVRNLAEAFLGRECIWVDCTGGNANAVPGTIDHVLVDARPTHRSIRKFEPGSEVITKFGRKGTMEFPVGKKWRIKFTDGAITEHQMVRKGQIFLTTLATRYVEEDRLQTLEKILASSEFTEATCIIFCRKRETVSTVYKYLKERFLGVVICHGGMTQHLRSKNVKKLRDGEAEILVATDVAARGLDVPSVTHVVNYELPNVVDDFVHRCGRTGRIGRKGTAVTMVTGRERIFKAVRRLIRTQGHTQLPEWCTLEGMRQVWRPKNRGVPFGEVVTGLAKKVQLQEREAYIEGYRVKQREQKMKFVQKAEALMRGEESDSDDSDEEEAEVNKSMEQRLQEDFDEDELDPEEREMLAASRAFELEYR
eukprot:TRINITY_DN13585_c1_g1_i3.p1 TRINITY_DN13585_c1_g1~~TRINITY_DN13585_c1_g1_i3.p1  ORF type:complete len:871 (-),score=243.01 TRINITY_DN13585_c1_g1_i3:122-2734(-)